MNKYFALVLGLFLAFFSIMPKSSFADWDKSNNNPISPSIPGVDHIYGPTLLKENGNYHMYYTSHTSTGWQINYSLLTDINNPSLWSNQVNNIVPIGSSDGWEKEASDPSVLKIGDKYIMWYTSTNTDHWVQGTDRFRTRRAISYDGIHWSPDAGWVMLGSEGKWDEGGTSRGRSVIYKDGIYHMWYAGTNKEDLGSRPFWSIGYATSIDGINWKKQNGGEPVLSKTNDWELKNFSYPNVTYENGIFKIYYTTGSGDLPSRIIYAESSNGLEWTKPTEKNPILNTSSGFDSLRLSYPFMLKVGNQYKLFYSGYNGNVWKMGYATKDIDIPTVPLLKQTEEPWQAQIYDRANAWSPSFPTISRWGCAITSLAMVLNYYGYEYMPDGNILDPGTLNTWLKNQSDGYVGQGLVNWQAVSRLSQKATSINNIQDFEALEFSYGNNNKNILTENLNKNIPVILEEPGHFVVATALQDNTFLINDPYYNRAALNEGYNNTFLSTRTYTPSNTDLSYIMITSDPSLTISILDNHGNTISNNQLENPIIDPVSNTKSGSAIKNTYVQQPISSSYKILISSPKTQLYEITLYLYDKNGEVKEEHLNGITHTKTNMFTLNFDKLDMSQDTLKKSVTYQNILNDLDAAYHNKMILKGVYTPLRQIISDSMKDYNKKRIYTAKIKLDIALQLTNSPVRLLNNTMYFSILNSDLKSLYHTI